MAGWLILGVIAVAFFLLGRKSRADGRLAVAYRAKLEADLEATSEALAAAVSSNTTQVHVSQVGGSVMADVERAYRDAGRVAVGDGGHDLTRAWVLPGSGHEPDAVGGSADPSPLEMVRRRALERPRVVDSVEHGDYEA